MSRARMNSAKWQAAFAAADDLYTTMECGCLALVLVDMPDIVKASREDIVREALAGRTLKRCRRNELPPLNCPTHEAERQARKAESA